MTAVQGHSAGRGNFLLRTLPQAVEAVATMVGCDLNIMLPELPASGGGQDLVVCLPVTGAVNGSLMLTFSATAGCFLAARMLGREQALPLSAQALSALQEFGNILASGVVMACADRLDLSCRLHPPHIVTTVPAHASETVFIGVGSGSDQENFYIKVSWSTSD